MPDRGLLERASVRAAAMLPHAEDATWALEGVRMAQVTFEVDRDAALVTMPSDVSRPVPCYGRVIAVEAADSPAGSLRMAGLFVGGRHKMLPRNVLVDGIVDGRLAAVTDALGSPYRAGSIALRREAGRVEVEIAGDEGMLARLVLPALNAVDRSMLRWDPWLGFSDVDGVPQIVEYSLRPDASEAFLSKGAIVETGASLPRGHTWRKLRNLNTISSSYLEGRLEIALPVVQQPLV